ncbi:MAG TPA: Uma2 family endonuclease, partial [Candidatus Tectomicrobia bacterium]
FQLGPLIYTIDALRAHFQGRDDVYVAGDLFLYYEEGNPRAVVAPDIFVVLGAPNHPRSSYMLWREPKAPDFVLEITSQSTRVQDQGTKRERYTLLGVQEYFQYDPTRDYLEPPLQGLRLVGQVYQPILATILPEGALVLRSAVLGLELHLEEGTLRLYEPTTGHKLLSYQEIEQARQEAEQGRQAAEERARAAEARVAELEARLRALQATPPLTPPPSADAQS